MAGGKVQVVECLAIKHEPLSSNPITAQEKKKENLKISNYEIKVTCLPKET
jgi:hypothetical protein